MSDNLKLCSSIKFNWLTIPCTEACCTRQEAKAPMYTHLWHYAGVHLVLSIICLCRNHQSSTCGWVVRHLSITYLWLGCRSPVKNIYLWLGCQSPVNHLPVTRPSVICGSPTCDWAIESLACDWAVSHLWITYLWLSHQSPVKSPVNHLCVIEPSVTCQSPTCDWAVSHLSITYLWLGCQSPVNHLSITYLWLGWLVGGMGLHPLQSSVLQKFHLFTHLRILPFQFSDARLQSRHSGCPATLFALHFILEISQLRTQKR